MSDGQQHAQPQGQPAPPATTLDSCSVDARRSLAGARILAADPMPVPPTAELIAELEAARGRRAR